MVMKIPWNGSPEKWLSIFPVPRIPRWGPASNRRCRHVVAEEKESEATFFMATIVEVGPANIPPPPQGPQQLTSQSLGVKGWSFSSGENVTEIVFFF